MSSLSITLGDAPFLEGSVKALSLKDCQPQNLKEESLQSLEIVVTAPQLSDSAVWIPLDLAAFVPALASHATVSIRVLDAAAASPAALQPIHTAFLLAGLRKTTESKRGDGTMTWTATKVPASKASNAVRLNNILVLNDGNTEEIDEESLLQSSDARNLLGPPPAMSSVKTKGVADDDCGGREPCDNCTCGRAGGAMKISDDEKKDHDHDPVSSSCGKCSLGDAFRCASCPHLGKPAWKPGEEHLVLSLDLQDDL